MPARLAEKICLISGASGIAAATARLAAEEGARVFAVGLEAGQCEALAALVPGLRYAVADLTDAAAVERVVRQCLDAFGRIDALYNVAGASGRPFGDGPLDRCSEEGWERTLAVNLKTVFLLSRRVLRQMLEQPVGPSGLRGTVLNMGSVSAFSPQADYFATHAYAAAKGAVVSLSLAMAAYYAPRKIRVNVIAPGLVRTPMSLRAQRDPEIMEYMKKKQPLAGGILEAEDVARASVFLLSDESRHITGQVLAVDGGWRVS
jgi:NAD(P)-dependent dehydrogenase (short-subunit alcohol dehydrogenase family)